ncbi:MAG: hypothetical protein WA824_10960 [Candidatus Sulfotelmatobacter sp.]
MNSAALHTRLTYHRTWETGLGVAIRVTTFDPDFFVLDLYRLVLHFQPQPVVNLLQSVLSLPVPER